MTTVDRKPDALRARVLCDMQADRAMWQSEYIGLAAGELARHMFLGGATICVLCFGFRDDPRHWAPQQAELDADVAAYEDRKPLPRKADA